MRGFTVNITASGNFRNLGESSEAIEAALHIVQREVNEGFRERVLDLAWALGSEPEVTRILGSYDFTIMPTAPVSYREDYLWRRFRDTAYLLAEIMKNPTYLEEPMKDAITILRDRELEAFGEAS